MLVITNIIIHAYIVDLYNLDRTILTRVYTFPKIPINNIILPIQKTMYISVEHLSYMQGILKRSVKRFGGTVSSSLFVSFPVVTLFVFSTTFFITSPASISMENTKRHVPEYFHVTFLVNCTLKLIKCITVEVYTCMLIWIPGDKLLFFNLLNCHLMCGPQFIF